MAAFAQPVVNETDDDFWNVPETASTSGSSASSGYTGALPQGYTQAQVDDFLARNPGDEHRLFEALTPSSQSGSQGGQQQASVSSAPQSIQPYGAFSFDSSQLGDTEGFKFRFDKAMEAIQRSGAARGTLLTPQVTKALQEEASGLASQELDAEYNRQAGTYDRNFNTYAWGEENRYNSQRTNRLDDWGFMDADRTYNRGVYESDRDFGYQQNRDTVGDTWRFIDYGYNAARNPQ